MNARPLLLTLLFAALPAFAQQATPEPAPAPTPATDAEPAPAPEVVPDARKVVAHDEVADRYCLRETGTLIRSRSSRDARGCIPGANGRSYTQDDLRGTGQTDIASALRMLDPAIR
ncbi:hypothetical protein DWG18_09445 [Lysobacter sp. TY2-98]|uniref:hypothetical protein n=1 Tax=Lysobacter sp. TY2-98 TaxID=2290922 RepID=UPI000E2023CA|nr:hypothetical protein [Lysobacter sp. TY2-98]AXK72472.1 hypothetical protein DWG18_09445 [Lysobacter sp. TY2-98]